MALLNPVKSIESELRTKEGLLLFHSLYPEGTSTQYDEWAKHAIQPACSGIYRVFPTWTEAKRWAMKELGYAREISKSSV